MSGVVSFRSREQASRRVTLVWGKQWIILGESEDYLRLSIGHGSHYDTNGKHAHTEDLHAGVSSPPNEANNQGHDATPATQDDVNRH